MFLYGHYKVAVWGEGVHREGAISHHLLKDFFGQKNFLRSSLYLTDRYVTNQVDEKGKEKDI